MTAVRRHLRAGAVAWLVCHALAFSALVPRDCCAAHAHAARESAPADDAACPMHDAAPPASSCAMSGTCQAPGAALAAVLFQAAVVEPVAHLSPHLSPAARPRPRDVVSRTLATPPDAPPPRS